MLACQLTISLIHQNDYIIPFFFFFSIEMRALLLLTDSLPTTVIISPAYPEFTALTEVFSDEQVGERPSSL